MEFVDILFMIVAAIIIILVLLQGGKEGASAVIMGGSQRTFANLKERGPEKVLMYLTFAMGGLFVFLAIWIRVVGK